MAARTPNYRKIPSVDSLLKDIAARGWVQGVPARIVSQCVRQAADEIRKALAAGERESPESITEVILTRVRVLLRTAAGPYYRRAVNATGIILHTGLGRAVLPKKAVEQVVRELSGYSLLQMDLDTGERSKRDERIEWLLKELTGAEAATVVNNNSAATALVLNTLGRGREVIVSRGQLVEIGGSFRLPEVMEASGVKLVEVGTTNKTHARDYEKAITENTAAIMRVHPSNYRIYGFTAEVALEELVRIAHARSLPVIDDAGSGALVDFSRFGFADEPNLPVSIKAGADVVISSADKLIGGPQGGIILGKAGVVANIRKNPFARIVRVGKLTLAALEATLSLFLDQEQALREVPTLAMLIRDPGEIRETAERMAAAIRRQSSAAEITVIDGHSQMGSGSLPTLQLPTGLVALSPKKMSPDSLALALRRREPPVVTRIQKDLVLVDPRTLLDGEDTIVVDAVAAILNAAE